MLKLIAGMLFFVSTMSFGAAKSCVIQMEDSANHIKTKLSVYVDQRTDGSTLYTVSNNESSCHQSPPSETTATVVGFDQPIKTDYDVPHKTPREIISDYKTTVDALLRDGRVNNDGQLTWTLDSDARCSPLEASFIMFWVYNWFYFG